MQNENSALVRVDRPVIVIAKPHPLSSERVQAEVEPGITVREIVGDRALSCEVEIGGVQIPEYMWGHVRPRAGAVIQVTRFPQGGGGGGGWKNIFRLIAFAALAVITYGVGSAGWMSGMVGAVFAGHAALAAAVLGIAGSLVMYALCPPASSGVGQATTPTQLKGISGVQNAADLYGAITCVFGKMRVFPKLAAQSYTELSGDNQYLRCLFDLGYYVNPLELSAMKIGTDVLTNYADVEYEIGESPSLFSQDIHELAAGDEMDDDGDVAIHTSEMNADELGIDLIFPAGLFAADSSGNQITATCRLMVEYVDRGTLPVGSTGTITRIPLVDGGFYHAPVSADVVITGDGAGAAATATVDMIGINGDGMPIYAVTAITVTNSGHDYTFATAEIQTNSLLAEDSPAVAGVPELDISGGTWENVVSAPGLTISNASATIDGDNIVVRSSVQKSLRIGLRWKVTRSDYSVKVYRVSTDYQGAPANSQSGKLAWTVLRTIRYSSPSTTRTTKLAMRIKATDQLNGNVSTFNLLISQVIPVWDGANWVNAESSNPAWWFRWLLRDCPANPRHVDPSRIDDEGLKEWAAECDAKGFTFNYTNDQITTIFELLKIICACGRASFTVVNGKYSVVRDIEQATPVQIFTPRNTSGFQGSRTFLDVVHALRVQFINPDADYQQDEVVVYDDGYDATNATKFEQLQIPGCTNPAMAWKLGRYHLAVGRLRPNVYSWNTDVEHLVCNRGDMILFASDVISVGLGWGRVKSITMDEDGNITKVTVDEPQTVTDLAKTYAMRFRGKDGAVRISRVTFAPDNLVSSYTLETPSPGINPGDLFLFGVQDEDSIPMLITKIEPTTDLAAKITAVDAAPEVTGADMGYNDSTGAYHPGVPVLVSSITGQAWLGAPAPPRFIFCSSAPNLSIPNDQGVTSPTLLVTVTGGGTTSTGVDHIEIRWRLTTSAGEWVFRALKPGESEVRITDAPRGITLEIQARYIGVNGTPSTWTVRIYTVASAQRIPLTVTGSVSGINPNAIVATTGLTALEDLAITNPSMTMAFKGNSALMELNVDFSAITAGVGSGAVVNIGRSFTVAIYAEGPPDISIAIAGDGMGAEASVGWNMTQAGYGLPRWQPVFYLFGGSGYTHATATVTINAGDGTVYIDGSTDYACTIDAGTVAANTPVQVRVLMDGSTVYGPVQVMTDANGRAKVSATQIITPPAGDHGFEVQALNEDSSVTVSAINRSLQVIELR